MLTAAPIETPRLDLVPLRVEHAEEMAQVLADPALHAFTGGAPATAGQLRSRYERVLAGPSEPSEPGESWLNWVLRLRDEGCLTGYVQATVSGDTAEIAWVVGTAWQGRGIAREAASALVEWLPVGTLVAHIHPEHKASAAVAAAAGLAPTDVWQDGELRWLRNM